MDDSYTSVSYVPIILERTECKAHGAGLDQPCWATYPVQGPSLNAACGSRIRRAWAVGYNPTTRSEKR